MKLLRVRGMPEEFEVAVTVGVSYLVYYVTNAPLHLSGVIAVVVYGLYGSATLKARTPPPLLPPGVHDAGCEIVAWKLVLRSAWAGTLCCSVRHL